MPGDTYFDPPFNSKRDCNLPFSTAKGHESEPEITAFEAAKKLKRNWISIDITRLAASLIEKRLKLAIPNAPRKACSPLRSYEKAKGEGKIASRKALSE